MECSEELLMPAKSRKQQQFMAVCANNPGNVKGKCPPKSVAKEFYKKPKSGQHDPMKEGYEKP